MSKYDKMGKREGEHYNEYLERIQKEARESIEGADSKGDNSGDRQ